MSKQYLFISPSASAGGWRRERFMAATASVVLSWLKMQLLTSYASRKTHFTLARSNSTRRNCHGVDAVSPIVLAERRAHDCYCDCSAALVVVMVGDIVVDFSHALPSLCASRKCHDSEIIQPRQARVDGANTMTPAAFSCGTTAAAACARKRQISATRTAPLHPLRGSHACHGHTGGGRLGL